MILIKKICSGLANAGQEEQEKEKINTAIYFMLSLELPLREKREKEPTWLSQQCAKVIL